VYFNLDFFIKAGCVERAIASANGPKISCQGMGWSGKKRQDEGLLLGGREEEEQEDRKAAEHEKRESHTTKKEHATKHLVSSTPSYTYASSVAKAQHTYIPMVWNSTEDQSPVVRTSVFTTTPTLTITTVIPATMTLTKPLLT
jgi:chitinase